MKNATSNSANSANRMQPTLPGVRDWTQPITVRGSELAQAIAEAQAAGWTAHRMKVLPEVIYELQFFRLAVTAEAGNKSGNPTNANYCQGRPRIPDSSYAPIFQRDSPKFQIIVSEYVDMKKNHTTATEELPADALVSLRDTPKPARAQ